MSAEVPRNAKEAAESYYPRQGTAHRTERTMTAALAPFGWTCGPDFWRRYYTDPWVFNLANAIERLTEQLSERGSDGYEDQPRRVRLLQQRRT